MKAKSPVALADLDQEKLVRVERSTKPSVLLIGRRTFWGPFVIDALREMGCAVYFQSSPHEKNDFRLEEFDVILGGQGCPRELHRLPDLAGTRATVFYVFPVQDSCWWLPALRQGVDCFGTPALRPNEFSAQLKHILKQPRRAAAQIAS